MRSCHTRCYDARCAHELCAICRAVSALRPLRSLSRLAGPAAVAHPSRNGQGSSYRE